MNKSDLIDALSTKENLAEKNASKIVNLISDSFTDTLKRGGRIEIRGCSGFVMGRNTTDGEALSTAAKFFHKC